MSRKDRVRDDSRGRKQWTLLDPDKKYPKWIEWIRDYGYYYKGILGVVAAVAAIAFCLWYLVSYQGADMRLYLVTTDTTIGQEPYYQLVENINAYVSDIDGDRNAFMRDQMIVVTEDPKTVNEKDMYANLDTAIASDETIALIVDDFGYEYVSARTQLRELAYFQVESDDELKFLLNDTPLMEGITLGDGRNYYVIMRYFENENYRDNYYLSGRTDLWVGMLLNNDKSEENDVVIAE